MNELTKIRYNCKQATYLIEKRQVGKITFRERIQLRIHLAGCSVCKVFQRQSILINRMVKDFFSTSSHAGAKLDEPFKKELQDRIEERLKKN